MARHVIKCDPFNLDSVRSANAEIRRIMADYNRRMDLFLEDIANIGAEAARNAYGSGGAVKVTVDREDNYVVINANGSAVVFLEFGAGDTVNTGNRFVNEMPFEVDSGSYSRAKGTDVNGNYIGEYARTGAWHFGGVRYTEVQPRNGMERAYEAMMNGFREAARRRFGT